MARIKSSSVIEWNFPQGLWFEASAYGVIVLKQVLSEGFEGCYQSIFQTEYEGSNSNPQVQLERSGEKVSILSDGTVRVWKLGEAGEEREHARTSKTYTRAHRHRKWMQWSQGCPESKGVRGRRTTDPNSSKLRNRLSADNSQPMRSFCHWCFEIPWILTLNPFSCGVWVWLRSLHRKIPWWRHACKTLKTSHNGSWLCSFN